MKTKIFRSGFTLVELIFAVALIALLAALALPSAVYAADDAGLVSFAAPSTITNNANNTSVLGSVIKIDKQHAVALIIKTSGNQAGTGNVAVQLARSYDGTNFESTPPTTLRFTNALAGATTIIGYHEIPNTVIGSAHSLKITGIQNYDASASGTNTTIGLLKKTER
jgi:prepilin-type N-terminal cleavage/methylation domain-containing protein